MPTNDNLPMMFPPVRVDIDEDGDRQPDRCCDCSLPSRRLDDWPGSRGWCGAIDEGPHCGCPIRQWTQDDQLRALRYSAASAEWAVEFGSPGDGEDSDDYDSYDSCDECGHEPCVCGVPPSELGCTCEECRSRLEREFGRVRAEHAAYANRRRNERRHMDSGESHTSNPCSALGWNGQSHIKGRARLGMEFECDARTDLQKEEMLRRTAEAFRAMGLRHAAGYMIAKRDGSVTGAYPIEFATVPCTVEEHLSVLRQAFPNNRFGDGVIRCWTNSSCGLHVHIGRRRISPLTAGKMAVFWHHPDNDSAITEIAGRSSNSYCRRSPVMAYEGDFGLRGDRYCALNLTNVRTIEVRAFRPSPNLASIAKNLEVVEASSWFCRWAPICVSTGTDAGGLRWDQFLLWLADPGHRKAFPHLHHWIVRRETQLGRTYRSFLPKNGGRSGPQESEE